MTFFVFAQLSIVLEAGGGKPAEELLLITLPRGVHLNATT
jgi:hypothetical protein